MKIHCTLYDDGSISISKNKPLEESYRATISPLVEMTKEQQEDALNYFLKMKHKYFESKAIGVLEFGKISGNIAESFIEETNNQSN